MPSSACIPHNTEIYTFSNHLLGSAQNLSEQPMRDLGAKGFYLEIFEIWDFYWNLSVAIECLCYKVIYDIMSRKTSILAIAIWFYVKDLRMGWCKKVPVT